MLGQVGMVGAVIWQQLQSHTGCAKLLSTDKSVAQPVAPPAANPPITVSAADLSSSTGVLSYSAPITMKDTVPIVLSLLYFIVERYDSVL